MKTPKTKIMVVDDDEAFLKGIKHLLEASGYSFLGATNVESALSILENDSSISLALLDFWLNGSIGLDLISAISQRKPEIPIVFMSGGGGNLSLEESTALAELRGSADFLYKPFSNKTLIERIEKAIS